MPSSRAASTPVLLLLLALPLLWVQAAPAHAEWTSLTGTQAPPLEVGTWLSAPEGARLTDLRGLAVVLLLEGAVDLRDAEALTRWNDLRAGWWEKGLRVVALVAQAPKTLPADLEFSIAVGTAPAYGAGSDPHALLIAPDGTVAWEGPPGQLTDTAVAKVLRKARGFRLDVKGAAARTPAAIAYKKGRLAEARTQAKQQDPQDASATHVTSRVEALLAYWQRRARYAAQARCYGEATTCLERVAKHFAGAEEGTAAAAELKTLKANREVAKECAAADGYARLRQALAKAGESTKKIAALAKKAERAAKKKPATRSVERAARLALALRADPATTALQAFIAKEKVRTSGSGWRNSVPRPPQVEFAKGKTYLWHLETNLVSMTLRFMPDVAPRHVSNAIYLTLLGFYDGITFYRVIPGFMAQGGLSGAGSRTRLPYEFDGEFDPGVVKHDRAGLLSAANAGPGTDGSEFFITLVPTPHLEGKHAIYGELIKGAGTLKRIAKLGSPDGPTKSTITIEKATISVE